MKEKKNTNLKKSTQFFGVIFIFAFFALQIFQLYWPTATLQVKDQVLDVQVAKNHRHIIKGLGGKNNLGAYDGMLFVYGGTKKHAMVMRDMNFPIDIIWLKNGVVVDIAAHVPTQPEAAESELIRYYPRTEANAVLEVSAGWTKQYGLKIGDSITQL